MELTLSCANRLIPRPPSWLRSVLDGTAKYLARRWGLGIPAWTEHPSRFLDRPYFPTPIEDLEAMLLAQNPLVFRRRLIFVEAEPPPRATLPRG